MMASLTLSFTEFFWALSLAGLDFAGVFRTFFGVDVVFATVDPEREREGFFTEIVRLARRWEFLCRT